MARDTRRIQQQQQQQNQYMQQLKKNYTLTKQ
jgi:hypothetical protein